MASLALLLSAGYFLLPGLSAPKGGSHQVDSKKREIRYRKWKTPLTHYMDRGGPGDPVLKVMNPVMVTGVTGSTVLNSAQVYSRLYFKLAKEYQNQAIMPNGSVAFTTANNLEGTVFTVSIDGTSSSSSATCDLEMLQFDSGNNPHTTDGQGFYPTAILKDGTKLYLQVSDIPNANGKHTVCQFFVSDGITENPSGRKNPKFTLYFLLERMGYSDAYWNTGQTYNVRGK